MESKEAKNIWIGIVVIVLIAIAYYFGAASKNTDNIQNTNAPDVAQGENPKNQGVASSANLDIQQQCSTSAKNYFDSWKSNPTNNDLGLLTGGNVGYNNHYNSQLGRCLIKIESAPIYRDAMPAGQGQYRTFVNVYLFDVYENKLVGSADIKMDNSLFLCMFPELPSFGAGVAQKECANYGSFMDKIKSYMSN